MSAEDPVKDVPDLGTSGAKRVVETAREFRERASRERFDAVPRVPGLGQRGADRTSRQTNRVVNAAKQFGCPDQ
jgi:hypothetical protein